MVAYENFFLRKTKKFSFKDLTDHHADIANMQSQIIQPKLLELNQEQSQITKLQPFFPPSTKIIPN